MGAAMLSSIATCYRSIMGVVRAVAQGVAETDGMAHKKEGGVVTCDPRTSCGEFGHLRAPDSYTKYISNGWVLV